MVGFAVAISWSGDPAVRDLVERMLDAIPHRGRHRHIQNPAPGVCLGQVSTSERRPNGDLQTRGPAYVADVRLDNGPELQAALGIVTPCPLADDALIAPGYQRWGTELANRLLGDFALAVWDSRRGGLYTARDPVGVRPLFYHRSEDRLLLASEVGQLLAVGAGEAGLDDDVVLDYLQLFYQHGRQTFFKRIARLLPGHWHWFGRDECREDRYWLPAQEEIVLPRQADYHREVRRLFRAAVATRLRSAQPLVAQMSGGIDSTSVVCMADEVLRENGAPGTRLHVASFVYPGLPCDETRFIEAVARRVRLAIQRCPGAAPATFAATEPDPAQPDWLAVPQGPESDLGLARHCGAAGLLSGLGGDEVFFDGDVCHDLAANGWWLTLLAQTLGVPHFYAVQGPIGYLGEALRRATPRGLRRAYRRVRPAKRPPPPAWLGPRLRPLWEKPPIDAPATGPGRSAIAQSTWKGVASPALWWQVEWEVMRAARQGLDMRFPCLDRRLVEFVLAVPFERRLPRGRMKILLREAMRGLVPDLILARKQVTLFDCLRPLDFQSNRARWQAILEEGDWLSGPYIDRTGARALFARLDKSLADCSNFFEIAILRSLVHLELWTRALQTKRLLPIQGA